ncbi:hypothetical protein [Mycolicibacterium sediminis]|nr:hypothetical protein [Mycolicibacterium sediminis]
MSRPDSVGGPGDNDADADPDMVKSTTEQSDQAEGSDDDAETGG